MSNDPNSCQRATFESLLLARDQLRAELKAEIAKWIKLDAKVAEVRDLMKDQCRRKLGAIDRAEAAEKRIAELEAEVARLAQERDDYKDDYLRRHKEAVDSFEHAKTVEHERDALRAALEHVTRECGALNKGPVAVEIARTALNHYNGNKEQ
jgi:DNA-binding transcriptional MerR regulator